jgi:hypothetical protein
MKHLIALLAMTLIGAPALAHEDHHPDPQPPVEVGIYGQWKTERPTRINPYAVAYGEVLFSEGKITFKSICSYHHGPIVTAIVEAAAEYRAGSFRILETKREINYEEGYSCEAYLSEGRIHYREMDGKLYLASHNTGWRMTLIR